MNILKFQNLLKIYSQDWPVRKWFGYYQVAYMRELFIICIVRDTNTAPRKGYLRRPFYIRIMYRWQCSQVSYLILQKWFCALHDFSFDKNMYRKPACYAQAKHDKVSVRTKLKQAPVIDTWLIFSREESDFLIQPMADCSEAQFYLSRLLCRVVHVLFWPRQAEAAVR